MPSVHLVYEIVDEGKDPKCVKVINLIFLMLPCVLRMGEGREKSWGWYQGFICLFLLTVS